MYKIVQYAGEIASDDTESQEEYQIIKSLSNDFTKPHELALKMDKKLVSKLSKRKKKSPEIVVPEIELRYVNAASIQFPVKVSASVNVVEPLREIIGRDQIQLYEQFVTLYLNRANKIIGYYRHSKGGVSGTVVDVRIVLLGAVKSLASGMILCHNHPSGNLNPSEQDKSITERIKSAAYYLDVKVLDHIIITSEDFYSFSDDGLMGIESGEALDGYQDSEEDDEPLTVDESKLKEFITLAQNLKF